MILSRSLFAFSSFLQSLSSTFLFKSKHNLAIFCMTCYTFALVLTSNPMDTEKKDCACGTGNECGCASTEEKTEETKEEAAE